MENVQYGDLSVVRSYALTRQAGVPGLVTGVQGAMSDVMLRSISLVFCHAVWSGIVAYFPAIALRSGRNWMGSYGLGLAVAALLHGLYNWLLSIQPTFSAGIVIGHLCCCRRTSRGCGSSNWNKRDEVRGDDETVAAVF